MNRIDTLFRSLLIAVPCVALVACGGAGGESGAAISTNPSGTPATETTAEATTEESTAAPIAADENGPDDPVALNADGVPVSELENDSQVEGSEADDQGYAETAAAEAAPAEAEEDVGDQDGVAQNSEALLSTRGLALKNEAKRIASYVNRPTSYYAHTTYMNESTGTRRTDCSGLTGYILNRVLRAAHDKVKAASGRSKPLAEDYYNYIAGRPTSASTQSTTRWRRITSVKNLKPGDVVVWKYPASNANTGHIMIVRDYPRAGRTSRSEWIVPIIDSTASPHSYNAYDSRGTKYTGVGEAAIGLKINSSGVPTAYYWTGGTSPTAVYKTVMMGRVE